MGLIFHRDDLLVSLKRTLVPIIVGAVAASFIGPHLDLGSLQNVVSGVVSAVYYSVVRVVEMYRPNFGLLLGARKLPIYVDSRV